MILIPKNTRWRTSLDTQGAAGLLLGDVYEGGVVFNPAGIFFAINAQGTSFACVISLEAV